MTMGYTKRATHGGPSLCPQCGLPSCECADLAPLVASYMKPSREIVLLERALGILHRMATERTGWRALFSRWYYPDEPLRNDAANLVREAGFGMLMPVDSRLIGDNMTEKNEGSA